MTFALLLAFTIAVLARAIDTLFKRGWYGARLYRPIVRIAGRWWQRRSARWRATVATRWLPMWIGIRLIPRIGGGAPEGIPGYLRIRVVNPRVSTLWSENFESTLPSGASAVTLWHSLGTEAGTDNSINYWNVTSGSPTYSAHVVTMPSGAGLDGGHQDWADVVFVVRFTWATSATSSAYLHYVDSNNWIRIAANSANIFLQKKVAGVQTTVTTTANGGLVNGTSYWLSIQGTGTTYSSAISADSAGSKGATIVSANGTISDSAVQKGRVAIDTSGAQVTFGGAFSNVCIVQTVSTLIGPNFWSPVVSSGEPAFCLSAASPQAGTYSASIQLNGVSPASGSGSWQQSTTLAATQATTQTLLQGQIKASAGTANISAGGLTTTNGTSSFANQTATGSMTANPTVSCNFSGAAGTAYFDSLSIVAQGVEITSDLPHLHRVTYEVRGMQPGNPGSNALGSFTIALFPPGSDGYAAAKAIYDQLDYIQRVEFYLGYSATDIGLGRLVYAGIITDIRRDYGGSVALFEISGVSDLFWANYNRPFPGELLSANYGSGLGSSADYRQARHYFGTNELGAADTFNPFTSANYTSTNAPSLSAGTWSGTTDNGLNVASCSTGTGAILISKTGITPGAQYNRVLVEVSGRLLPSSDTTNAGGCGIGITTSNASASTSVIAWIRAKANAGTGQSDLDVVLNSYNAGSLTQQVSSSALTNTEDAEGYVTFTVQLQFAILTGTTGLGLSSATVNGKVVFGGATGTTLITATWATAANVTMFPLLFFAAPATGSATCYLTNLIQVARYSDDLNTNAAVYKPGTIGTPTHSLPFLTEPGPTFLEIWTRVAAREGWYWRYTPQAYTVGSKPLGSVDLASDPGTDRTTSCIFSRRDGNLLRLAMSANADQIASGTVSSGTSGTDSGGIAPWRDISTITKYGVIDDQSLAVTAPNFNELQIAAKQISSNKVNLSSVGSKVATVLRDAATADKWRELDHVLIDDPEQNINRLSARILAYTFTEGSVSQDITLDQFSVDDPTLLLKRLQGGVFQMANKFGNR